MNNATAQEHINGFRQRLRADYYDAEAHYGLGVVYYNLGLHDAAVEQLADAARMMPESAEIQLQLAIVRRELVREGNNLQLAQAFQAVRNTLLLDPANSAALSLHVELSADTGDFDAAIDSIDRLMRVDPVEADTPRQYLQAARTRNFLDRGNWSAAYTLLNDMTSEQAINTLELFISHHQPITLYPENEAEMRKSEKQNRNSLTILTGVIALFVGVGLPEPFFIPLLIVPTLVCFVGLNSRIERNRQHRQVRIDKASIAAALGEMRELGRMAHMLCLRFAGETITDEELGRAELEIENQHRGQPRPKGCSGCFWPTQ